MRDSWSERLIVIVSADQLRSEGLRVSGGLSWETSVDDIVEELETNHALHGLGAPAPSHRHHAQRCRSVARSESAADGAHCQLVFDRKLCEGEWEENNLPWKAYGFSSIITVSGCLGAL